MTHIILLDGKLWAFEPPEKQPHHCNTDTFPNVCYICRDYGRACYLALEKKIEVDRSSFTDSCLISQDGQAKSMSFNVDGIRYYLDANEPIKWEGTVETVYQYKPDKNSTHWTDCHISVWQEYSYHEMKQFGLARKVVRIIAPVKEGLIEKLNKVSDKLDAEDKERRRLTFDRLSVNADAQHPKELLKVYEENEKGN